MRARTRSTAAPATLAVGLGLLVLCVLVNLADTLLPAPGLDPSWMLAAEYAAQHRLVFGRDIVFTYGPYHYLATHLFDPATYPQVIVYQVLTVVAAFWIALANRSRPALLAIAVALLLPQVTRDSFNTLALFGAFLICLQRRDLGCVLAVVLCGPLALAKYSFGLVILPLLALADFDRLLARRAPILTGAFLLAALAAHLAARQPISVVGEAVRNTLDVILGYGRAMQVSGPPLELVATTLAAFASALFVAALAWSRGRGVDRAGARDLRPAIAAAGYAWVLFLLFKMGFVRQDTHPLILHEAAPAALAMIFALLDRPTDRVPAPARLVFVALFAALVANGIFWRAQDTSIPPNPPPSFGQQARQIVDSVGPRLETGLAWASGGRFGRLARERREDLAALRRDFGPAVAGRVDAVPWDLAPLIGSGLRYDPRPVIQSYSAYTPALQALDRAHFQGPRAPDTLLLRVEDIDGRLPTLALGPSLPVIGQRYDAVGVDPLGLVLRRRATPRAATVVMGGAQPLALDRWTAAPGAPGRLVMAHIKVQRTLAGRVIGFLFREPLLAIELRTASGAVTSYRFVPGMAELGVAVSPAPKSWSLAALPLLDPASSASSEPVTAIRLVTNGKNWAFGDISVAYEQIALAPGFSAKAPTAIVASPVYAGLLQRLGLLDKDGAKARAFPARMTGADPKLCFGWFDSVRPLPDSVSLWEAAGWGWDVAAGRAFDRILFADSAGRLVGGGSGGLARPDVPAARPQVRSPAAGWKGVALRGGGAAITAYGVMQDGRACPLGRKDWP